MFKQRHKFYSQIDDELIDSEAGIFRTQSSQDNQERGYLLNENGRKDML